MKDRIVKYLAIAVMIAFFTLITIEGLKNCGKPEKSHHHHHTPSKVKPENENRRDYIVEDKIPPHVKEENIIYEIN
jgi:hypothetical protein